MPAKSSLTPAQWAKVDRLVVSGELSLRAIADDHGISESALRKRIRTRGLVRNLGKKVAARAEQKLMDAVSVGLGKAARDTIKREVAKVTDPAGPRKAGARIAAQVLEATEEERVEVAATAIATIIGQQRQQAHTAQQLVIQLVADLTEAARHRLDVEAIIDAHLREMGTITDPETGEVTRVKVDEKQRASMHAAIGLPAHAKAAKQLVDALDKVQIIARRAWNITDAPLDEPEKNTDDSKMLEEIRALAIAWKQKEEA